MQVAPRRGRIAVTAPLVQGVQGAIGTPASGRSTPGQPSVYKGLRVSSITFDYSSNPATGDGLTIRIDEATAVPTPEWDADLRVKVASGAAFDSSTSGPAAYLSSGHLLLQARFQSASPQLASAVIKATTWLANGGSSPYGELGSQNVVFTSGDSGPVTFLSQSTGGNKIAAYDLVIRWQLVSGTLTTGETVSAYEFRETRHRIYSVLRAPIAPQAQPWAKVLELASRMTSGLAASPSDSTVLMALANGAFYSAWRYSPTSFRFFQPVAEYIYDPSQCLSCDCNTGGIFAFPLQRFLDMLADWSLVMQCSDNSDLASILAASQGVDAKAMFIRDNSSPAPLELVTEPYYPAGDNPDCRLDLFAFHVVASLSEFYDVSGRCPVETLSGNCGGQSIQCTPGENHFGLARESYMPRVFHEQPLGRTLFLPLGVTGAPCQSQ